MLAPSVLPPLFSTLSGHREVIVEVCRGLLCLFPPSEEETLTALREKALAVPWLLGAREGHRWGGSQGLLPEAYQRVPIFILALLASCSSSDSK
jgi:hypothetical protein